jgi:hypothetical protein
MAFYTNTVTTAGKYNMKTLAGVVFIYYGCHIWAFARLVPVK